MTNCSLPSSSSGTPTTPELLKLASLWLKDCEIARLSGETISFRKTLVRLLAWYLHDQALEHCGTDELKLFLHYVTTGHTDPRGRWGNPRFTKPNTPSTIATYRRALSALCHYLVREELLAEDLSAKLPRVIDRPDDVQPFADDQVRMLLDTARKGRNGKRNYALLCLLLDSAIRVSEACSITMSDLDITGCCASIAGKGSKRRSVYFSPRTAKAIFHYVGKLDRRMNEPLFQSERSGPMTPMAVRMLFRRLGNAIGITGVRCSPHTMRHAAATGFLRAGGGDLALQRMLGHTTLAMTKRYAQVVDADVEAQHRLASPVERIFNGGKR